MLTNRCDRSRELDETEVVSQGRSPDTPHKSLPPPKSMTTGEGGLALLFVAAAVASLIAAAKAEDVAFAFHAYLAAAASVAAVFAILNHYYDRPTALPPQEIAGDQSGPARTSPASAPSTRTNGASRTLSIRAPSCRNRLCPAIASSPIPASTTTTSLRISRQTARSGRRTLMSKSHMPSPTCARRPIRGSGCAPTPARSLPPQAQRFRSRDSLGRPRAGRRPCGSISTPGAPAPNRPTRLPASPHCARGAARC